MKIGILTLPLHSNFGGILQAYALQNVLESMGHETYVISINHRKLSWPFWKKILIYGYRILKKIKDHNIEICLDKKINNDVSVIEMNTRKFIDQYINLWKINDLKDIKEDTFDAIVVGSDQIWRKSYFEATYYANYTNAFLEFTKKWNIKRIAYACSFGFDKWIYNSKETHQIGLLLKNFNAVSVREESAQCLCNYNLNINAAHVVDPTLLLTSEDYKSLIDKKDIFKRIDGEMMVYLLDDSEEQRINIMKVSKLKGYKPYYFDAKIDQIEAPTLQRIQYPVSEWLAGFLKAKLIVTDSFHACVFSIIFKKPFMILKNKTRGNTRLDSLLKQFNIQKDELEICHTDSYEVNERLDLLKSKSFEFLKKTVGIC